MDAGLQARLLALAPAAAAGERDAAWDSRELALDAGPPAAWYITAGEVEVFASSRDAGGEERSRAHLATASAGQLLVAGGGGGEDVARPGHGMALLGVRQHGARVVPIDAAHMRRLLADGDELAAELAGAFDTWLAKLFATVAHTAVPRGFRELRPDTETDLEAAGLAARPAQGLVWVRHRAGSSYFMGQEELRLGPGPWLPLAPRAWLSSAEPARLTCTGTAALVAQDDFWAGLGRFHELLLAYLGLQLAQAERQQRERLTLRAERDRAAVAGACAHLLSVLATAAPESLGVPETADPLLAACRLVGEAQGIAAPRLPDSLHRARQADELAAICAAWRVRHRRVLLRGDWWRRDNGPLLGFQWVDATQQRRRPVALLPVSPHAYELADPASGTRQPADAALAESLTGEAYMFYPPLPERPLGKGDLVHYTLARVRPELGTILAMGVAGGLLGLLVPIATAEVFGSAIPGANASQLVAVTLALIAAGAGAAVFQVTRSVAVLRLGAKIEGSLQAAVWDRLLALPATFFRRFTVGDLAERSLGIDRIREQFTGNAATAILGAFFSLFNLLLLFYYSLPLALLSIGLVALMAGVTWLLTALQLRRQRRLYAAQGKLASLVFGLIHGIAKLRVAGAEQRGFALWADGFAEQRRHTIQSQRLANVQAAFNAIYTVLTSIGIFAMVGFSSAASMSLGDFLAFNAAFSQFLAAALAMIAVLASIIATVSLYERLSPILAATPEVDQAKADAGELTGDLEFSHVSFSYSPDGPPVVDGVSFRAAPGEFIALVGPSGGGKSTCLRLILGFEKPASGSIYFDGQDLSGLSAHSVRRQIGVVLQTGRPLAGDIRSNILGSSNLRIEDAWEAARMVGLEEDIRSMPMGMFTLISEGADTFSGGQKQRILIARAIVHRPRIILFDEATSALDNRSQEIVSRSLERLKATRIVIAHRLSTIANADRIYVVENGRVVEQGTYQELARQGGLFSRLVARQTA
ncbi:MAG TPA: NHLP bacteriocin export ABC transporter permease/ATPase subunit [Thermoanaerobaculia bacterium]